MNEEVIATLLPYSDLIKKGYSVNSLGELENENQWIIVEPQEFQYLGQTGIIVEVKQASANVFYCSMQMNDGVIIDCILEDCVRFNQEDLTLSYLFEKWYSQQEEELTDLAEVKQIPTCDDISEAMYYLIDLAEKGGYQISISCCLNREGRKINLTYGE